MWIHLSKPLFYTVCTCVCELIGIHFYRELPNRSGEVLRPRIHVSDGGSPPNNAICDISICLFNLEMTVTIFLIGNDDDFKSDVFEELTSNILELDIKVAEFTEVNNTYFFVRALGEDNGIFVEAAVVLNLFSNLTQADLARLASAGFFIDNVVSNAPTTPPFIPTRQIPGWAVAVIVVVNSVIIIATLLLIMFIILRRFYR